MIPFRQLVESKRLTAFNFNLGATRFSPASCWTSTRWLAGFLFGGKVQIRFDTRKAEDYRRFLAVRKCPVYHFKGSTAIVPDEYAKHIGMTPLKSNAKAYKPEIKLFDYQADITKLAIQKRKYAVFADCGLGKTLIILEYARHVAKVTGGRVLIVSPLMVCNQTVAEAAHWYGERNGIDRIRAMDLQYWLDGEYNGFDSQIAVTNYEAIREGLRPGKLAGLILDESSMLKSHYGASFSKISIL